MRAGPKAGAKFYNAVRRDGIRFRLRPVNQRSYTMRKWACVAAAAAGLTGAGGIILAGAAAHGVPDPRLQTAANILMLHAAAALAVCGIALAVPQRGIWFLGAAGLFLSGSLFFGGDLSARALAGTRLFPMAAPLGGTLLIFGWALVTLAAVIAMRQRPEGKPDQNIRE
jgi:uncharacterized membrane protein YgdD (TMEM256/DUF423 family)